MKSLLYNFWFGKITLWKSYWIVGELINALIIIIIFNIELRFFNNAHLLLHMPLLNFSDLNFINKCIILIWTIFITVGIWRSAEKYNGKIVTIDKIGNPLIFKLNNNLIINRKKIIRKNI